MGIMRSPLAGRERRKVGQSDLLQAATTFLGANLPSVDALVGWLDLEHRNVHVHVPFGPPFPAINCGEIKRLS